jgi:hypothetical protein
VVVTAPFWETIATEAARESALWEAALRPPEDREPVPVFSPLNDERYALGLETIYEGYLLHYGRPRLFEPPDRDTTVLLGDYLYAHGLVRIAELGEVTVVGDLAELLSVCAHLRAQRSPGDGVAWAAAVALLGSWRDTDGATWLAQAQEAAGAEAVERALALHTERVAGH